MNNHNVIGVDLAKTVFQVAIMNDRRIISNKKLSEQLCLNSSPIYRFRPL
jgi:ATP-dependent protease Clp ATPase subunit